MKIGFHTGFDFRSSRGSQSGLQVVAAANTMVSLMSAEIVSSHKSHTHQSTPHAVSVQRWVIAILSSNIRQWLARKLFRCTSKAFRKKMATLLTNSVVCSVPSTQGSLLLQLPSQGTHSPAASELIGSSGRLSQAFHTVLTVTIAISTFRGFVPRRALAKDWWSMAALKGW